MNKIMVIGYGQHQIYGYLNGKAVLAGTVILYSNMWKQFIPSEAGVIIDRLVIPSMVDFDSLHISTDSLLNYNLA